VELEAKRLKELLHRLQRACDLAMVNHNVDIVEKRQNIRIGILPTQLGTQLLQRWCDRDREEGWAEGASLVHTPYGPDAPATAI
jgi:hypothetical protein